MNNEPHSNPQRLHELLADRALGALSAQEQTELDQLLKSSAVDPESFERAAALAALALNPGPHEPMPAELMARISHDAERHLAAARQARPKPSQSHRESRTVSPAVIVAPKRGARKREVLAWCASAACLLLAVLTWLHYRPANPNPAATTTLAEARQALIQESPDAVQVAWTSTEEPTAKGAGGDVVWSNAKQQGFLRLQGLAANDAKTSQYQLWIFDAKQDERYPIDGGVFDVDPNSGEVIVPIRAKLHVVDPKMFAVTIEKPGGVVVSSRDRIALLAKVASSDK